MNYHHTHADLAMEAIRQNAVAVVEKPLAVTREQFDSLSRTLEQAENPGFFSCFHKRYSRLHELFLLDKGCPEGEPIDMHCIVYEIPLPAHHWYNWPNSGSRLISNGCHWIDYFMFINGFSAVDEMRKWNPGGKDVYVQLKLKNGACFSMSLTEKGSQRLGVRENIELRVGGVTVSMVDGAVYRAENRNRVLRKVKINPELVYARMYKNIIKKILSGQSGDTMKSLRSTEVTILLEELN